MRELLEEVTRAESPSSSPESQEPVQRIFARALRQRGFRARRIRGRKTGGQLLALPSGGRRRRPQQLLVGHCDTVWPHGTLAEMPVAERAGRLHGPGVYDMKGGLVQMVFALEAIHLLGLEPQVAPIVLVNSDEEIGSPESTDTIRRLATGADRVLVLEPSLGPEGRLKTARKGVGRFEVRVLGRAAHAGLEPERGASAILELSLLVPRIFELNDPGRGVSVNVGTIDGGLRPNVVAPESSAMVDIRVPTVEDARRVERSIRSLTTTTPGTALRIEGGFAKPPMERTPDSRRLWRRAERAAHRLGLEIGEADAGGASDGNTTAPLAPTLDGLGAVGGGAHARDEHLVLDQMPLRAALLAELILDPPLSG